MKTKTRLILALALLLAFPLAAQEGLNIGPIFTGEYNRNKKAVVVILKGKKLEPYRLTYFHSISVEDSPADVTRFETAVLADGPSAVDAQVVRTRDGLVACYYQLPPPPGQRDGPSRFILFRKNGNRSATLIYLEGHTELEELIQIFMNKKNKKENV